MVPRKRVCVVVLGERMVVHEVVVTVRVDVTGFVVVIVVVTRRVE